MCLAIPFGIKDNQLVDVDSVESGLKCNCTCPVCKSPLVAKKGGHMVHHFAHYHNPDCKGALETSLHLAAKELLVEERHIKLPRLFLGNYSDDYDGILISDIITISFDRVKLEKKIGEIIPDLIIEAKDHKLLIEIEVTHKITDSKLKKIKDLNISTIKIDLSKKRGLLSKEELRSEIVYNISNKNWVYNKVENKIYKDLLQYSRVYEFVYKEKFTKIYECPEHKQKIIDFNWAYLFEDCIKCKYLMNYKINYENNTGILNCLAESKKDIKHLIRKMLHGKTS